MSTIGITGGTGFVGRHVAALLTSIGHRIIIFSTRKIEKSDNPYITYSYWNPSAQRIDPAALAQLDGMVHLAGAGIADKRWTDARKNEIVESRIPATRFLVQALAAQASACKAFISASAIGIYGPDRQKEPFTENDAACHDFLGTTCHHWEQASLEGATHCRTVVLRFGIVLGREAGAFPKFEEPTRYGLYPILGTGRQVISWIEITDLARMIVFALEQEHISGIYNAVAPQPVTQAALMRAIGRVKKGIHLFAPAPAFILRALLGEMSGEVLKSCTVSAGKMKAAGFDFNYANIEAAIKEILNK